MTTLWSTMGVGQLIEPSKLSRQVWNAETAQSIPGMGRALQIYGLIATCALQAMQGLEVAPVQPRILERPDPDMPRSTFVSASISDWWLHGNTCSYITVAGANNYPLATRYYPAHRWTIQEDRNKQPVYMLDGQEVDRDRVIHVRRGVDPNFIHRGMGVVEQHLRTLNRAGLQEAAETANLTDRGMPAVAIITPNQEIDPDANDAVADEWVKRFRGSDPKPGIFPKDTTIQQLSWNPTDSQMVEARSLTLKDLANLMNLDGYWLNAEGGSHNYKSPGLMFLSLLKVSLAPVMDVFEDEWSFRWVPRGTTVRFDRPTLLRDDLETMVRTFAAGKAAGLFPDVNEARGYMGFPPIEIPEEEPAEVAPVVELVPPVEDDADEEIPDEENAS